MLCVCFSSAPSAALSVVLSRVDASLWLLTTDQRCPLVRVVYLRVAEALRKFCSDVYLSKINDTLMLDLQSPQTGLQVCVMHDNALMTHIVCLTDIEISCISSVGSLL